MELFKDRTTPGMLKEITEEWRRKLADSREWYANWSRRYPSASEYCCILVQECFSDMFPLLGRHCEMQIHHFRSADPVHDGKSDFPEAFLRETLMVQVWKYNDPQDLKPALCFEVQVNENNNGLRGPVLALLNKTRLQDAREVYKMVHKKSWMLSLNPTGHHVVRQSDFQEDILDLVERRLRAELMAF